MTLTVDGTDSAEERVDVTCKSRSVDNESLVLLADLFNFFAGRLTDGHSL